MPCFGISYVYTLPDKVREVAQVWVRWNKMKIDGDDAMIELHRIFKQEVDKAWLEDQKETLRELETVKAEG